MIFVYNGCKVFPPEHVYANPVTVVIQKDNGEEWRWEGEPGDTADVTDPRVITILSGNTNEWTAQ